MFFKFVILSICVKFVVSFPDGAPEQACETLTPIHGLNQPRPEENPVDLLLESNVIQAGELTSIALRARNDTMFGPLLFRGFIVQARILDQNLNVTGRVVGTFELSDGVRHVPCPQFGPNSVVTHTINSEKAYIRLLWRAPTNVIGDSITVNFYYSIVWMVPMFWTYEVSSPLIIENPTRHQNPN